MFGSMRSGGGNTLRVVGSGFHSAGEKLRPNILFAMALVTALGVVVSVFGFWMDGNEAIIAGAGVGAIVAIVNLAGKILDDDFGNQPGTADAANDSNTVAADVEHIFWDDLLGKTRPNVLIAMVLIALLGGAMSYLALTWTNADGSEGNEAVMAAAGVGAVIAISNLAGKILEKESDARGPRNVREFFATIRPNILLAMIMVGGIGLAISILGYRMTNDGLVTAAGVGSIVAITNLGGKILEVE